jgi:hypothetical protein
MKKGNDNREGAKKVMSDEWRVASGEFSLPNFPASRITNH